MAGKKKSGAAGKMAMLQALADGIELGFAIGFEAAYNRAETDLAQDGHLSPSGHALKEEWENYERRKLTKAARAGK